MAEYTYKDIIIDPTSEEAKNCIGKMVYYADNPSTCLSNADNEYDNFCDTLLEIDTSQSCPFVLESRGTLWQCIIPKKEEPKPEYVPFESIDEFLDAYEDSTYISCGSVGNKLINHGGIWLKRKCNSILIAQCIEISDKGIVLGINHGTTYWKKLLDDYEFLDGTPCGKIKE